MASKWLLKFSALVVALTLVSACGANNDNNEPADEEAPVENDDRDINENDLDRAPDHENQLPEHDTDNSGEDEDRDMNDEPRDLEHDGEMNDNIAE